MVEWFWGLFGWERHFIHSYINELTNVSIVHTLWLRGAELSDIQSTIELLRNNSTVQTYAVLNIWPEEPR